VKPTVVTEYGSLMAVLEPLARVNATPSVPYQRGLVAIDFHILESPIPAIPATSLTQFTNN
jgi:hypothetical protein